MANVLNHLQKSRRIQRSRRRVLFDVGLAQNRCQSREVPQHHKRTCLGTSYGGQDAVSTRVPTGQTLQLSARSNNLRGGGVRASREPGSRGWGGGRGDACKGASAPSGSLRPLILSACQGARASVGSGATLTWRLLRPLPSPVAPPPTPDRAR